MTVTVKPGQVWAGSGKNSARRLRVTSVDCRWAYVESWWEDRVGKPCRSTHIDLCRFRDQPTRTGFHLIEDVTE